MKKYAVNNTLKSIEEHRKHHLQIPLPNLEYTREQFLEGVQKGKFYGLYGYDVYKSFDLE